MTPEDASNGVSSIANYIKISVSPDRLFAYVDFRDPPTHEEGISFSGQEFLYFLKNSRLTQGLISESEAHLLLQSWMSTMEGVEVAHGTPPTPSSDDNIEFYFEQEVTAAPMHKENGTVDYRELGILQMVNANERLAKIIPGILGRPGIDVYGTEIPVKPPKQLKLPKGKFTYESEDGKNLFAEISGQIVYISGQKVSISPVYHVKEDVDFSTGNINFNGSVLVHGNVNAGFRIEAEGNIEVMGIVEAADLKAVGDIVIRGGIQGSTTTRIISGGSIRALYLQNVVVNAAGTVIVSDSMMNSVVQAMEVRVVGKRGLLVGGLTRIQKGLFARVVGSHMGAKTRIELIFYKLIKEKILELEAAQAKKMQEIAKIEETLAKMQQLEKLRKNLTPEQLENKNRLIETLSVEKQILQNIYQEYQDKLEEKKNADPSIVEIGTVVYPGVSISTGEDIYEVNEVLHTTKFVQDLDGLRKVK